MWKVVLSATAVGQLRELPKAVASFIKDGIREQLVENDPGNESRNKFRLRRPSPHAEYELRLREWRVFYRLQGETVQIVLIGRKEGNTLKVGKEEFRL